MSLRALDLFSGIGGITYGLRGIVSPVVYVEKNKDAREFLKQKHPDIPVFEDVCTFDATELKDKIDIITAGWPCTGFSTAGKGTGFDHEASGLFTEIIRITKECEPDHLFLENSHVLSNEKNIRVIVDAFDTLDYDCRWLTCHATIVGAPHQRHRWFCLVIKRGVSNDIHVPQVEKFDWSMGEPEKQIKTNNDTNKFIIGAVGNAVVPDQIRYAFCYLLGKKCVAIQPKSLNIILSPVDVKKYKPKSKPENIVIKPIIKKYWGTPLYSYRNSSKACRVLTTRGQFHLVNQVRFSQYGIEGYHLHGLWCAWLMGYPSDYFTLKLETAECLTTS
jgi:DNA-cytosine methyltransferase